MAWTVRHHEGSCALKHQNRKRPPPESVTSVPTLCDHFVILPFVFDGPDAEPDCKQCVEKLHGDA